MIQKFTFSGLAVSYGRGKNANGFGFMRKAFSGMSGERVPLALEHEKFFDDDEAMCEVMETEHGLHAQGWITINTETADGRRVAGLINQGKLRALSISICLLDQQTVPGDPTMVRKVNWLGEISLCQRGADRYTNVRFKRVF